MTATPGPVDSGKTTVRIDCHVHTEASFDSEAPLDRVTNALAAVDRAELSDLLVVPGVEVSTAGGHLLGIGVTERPPLDRPVAETLAWIRAAGGVGVVPHPFQRTRHGLPAGAITDCDGVEVFNAHALVGFRNEQARRFAVREDYPRFAGSDAHRAADVGRAYTEVAVEASDPTAAAVVEAMRAGRTRAVGNRTPRRRYVRKLVGSAKRNSARLFSL